MTTNTVERAFQLARSGECASLGDIVKRLKQEGLTNVEAYLTGQSIRTQLRRLCEESRPALPTVPAVA